MIHAEPYVLRSVLLELLLTEEVCSRSARQDKSTEQSLYLLIPINAIKYSRRTTNRDEIESLAVSIRTHGLLHPISVFQIKNGYRLATGLKRLLAVKSMNWLEVPCEVIEGKYNWLKGFEVHLHENLKRHNAPWWEIVKNEKRLHELRQKEHGKKGAGRPGKEGKEGWSIHDTARELGIAFQTLAEDIQIAEVLHSNPNLLKVKDKTTARKLVRQILKRATKEYEQAENQNFDLINQVLLGDSLGILKQIPKETFDACITDPPWSKFFKGEEFQRDESTLPVFEEIFRLLKKDSLLYAFVGFGDFHLYQEELSKFGFRVSQLPLIWVKKGVLSRGLRPWEYTRDYEQILVAAKGDPVLTSRTQESSILEVPPVPTPNLLHPNEKPLSLMSSLIIDCTNPGASILDPFAGSGSTLVAARNLGRNFLGIEREKRFHEVSLRRLNEDQNRNNSAQKAKV